MLDETERNGLVRRQKWHSGRHFGTREPSSVFEFLVVQMYRVRRRVRGEPQHQRGRERPRLRGMVLDGIDLDPRFLQYLTSHRISSDSPGSTKPAMVE